MAEVFQKYRIIMIIVSLIVFAASIWLILSRHNLNKVPSRGVFVMNTVREAGVTRMCISGGVKCRM